MKGIELLLFGISVILFAGFAAVVEAVGYVFGNGFVWLMLLGLVVSFAGLLTDDSEEPNGAGSGDGPEDADGPNDGEDDDAADEGERESRGVHSANRFPPM